MATRCSSGGSRDAASRRLRVPHHGIRRPRPPCRAYDAHGDVEVPTFSATWGTQGSVKTLTPGEVASTGARIVLGNTYHLMLRPTAETIARLGGLHGFTRWPHAMTHRLRRASRRTRCRMAARQPPRPPSSGDRGRRVHFQILPFEQLGAPTHARERRQGASPSRGRHPNAARCLPTRRLITRRRASGGRLGFAGAVGRAGRPDRAATSRPGAFRHRAGGMFSRYSSRPRRKARHDGIRRLGPRRFFGRRAHRSNAARRLRPSLRYSIPSDRVT